MTTGYIFLPVQGGGISSINSDTTAAQTISAGTGISVATSAGNTTITNTASSATLIATGTRAAPIAITAIGGITPAGVQREMIFIQGSGGPVTITANPQIAAGTTVGQELYLVGCSDVNTVTINNGTGLELNGACLLENTSTIYLIWTNPNWSEIARNDI